MLKDKQSITMTINTIKLVDGNDKIAKEKVYWLEEALVAIEKGDEDDRAHCVEEYEKLRDGNE